MHPQSFFRFAKFKQRLSNSPWLWAEVSDGFIRLFVHTTAVGDCIFIGSDLCVGVCVSVPQWKYLISFHFFHFRPKVPEVVRFDVPPFPSPYDEWNA